MIILGAPFAIIFGLGVFGDLFESGTNVYMIMWFIMLLVILGGVPLLIGVGAQRMRGRTGIAWALLAFVVMFSMFHITGYNLVSTFLYGALPVVLIVATLPNRKEWNATELRQ